MRFVRDVREDLARRDFTINAMAFHRLLDFGFKKQTKKFFKKYKNQCKSDIKSNELVKFIEFTYSYSMIALNKYSSKYSKKLYSQPALFTIVALKIYLNMIYREIGFCIVFKWFEKLYL